MIQRNKCNINFLSKVLIVAFVSFSVCVLFSAYKYKKNGISLQNRLRKSYEGLSPNDYE
ncbi:hypothetical protein [Candidatus Ruminimicrobium bovinum]|uniref:hypothetical protein n=1 Tax=Candidatus Ruminimicrobium bovinum TaxID=3242779 RepID=UPI0039B8F41B